MTCANLYEKKMHNLREFKFCKAATLCTLSMEAVQNKAFLGLGYLRLLISRP